MKLQPMYNNKCVQINPYLLMKHIICPFIIYLSYCAIYSLNISTLLNFYQ